MGTIWVLAGSVSGFIAVAMGAFGAHGLAQRLDAKALAIYQTAAQYQMYHALALLALGLLVSGAPGLAQSSAVRVAGWGFVIGSVLFSGSLYALSITGYRLLGMVTPIGGVLFLAGWVAFGVAALQKSA